MKITKRQLRQIIKEEKQSMLREFRQLEYSSEVETVLGLLSRAAELATLIGPGDEDSKGTESHAIAAALEDVWVAAGFDPQEIFR